MTIRCLMYRVLDRFKQTWLASLLFFGGERFQHFGPITVVGMIRRVDSNETDGDFCFDIAGWHCEVTPCYPLPDDVKSQIVIGAWVEVTGIRTYDPPHFGNPSHNEVHPVLQVRVLWNGS